MSLYELRRLWEALDQASSSNQLVEVEISSMSIVLTSAIKLLILIGARRGEVAAMRWDELNLNEGIWMLPSERTKNRQAHIIHLSSLAIEVLQSLLPISGHSL